MSEKTRKGLVFSILVLALVWAYFSFSGPKDGKQSRPVNRRDQPANTPAAISVIAVAGTISDSLCREYESRPWGKDPFYYWYEPPSDNRQVQQNKVGLHLLGVLFRQYQAHALINDRVVTIGDEIEGFRVTDISRDSVILKKDETILTLWVAKESS